MVEERQRLLATEDLIAALGYEPVGVETAARLLEIIEQDDGRFDVLLICLCEVSEDSWTLLSELCSRCPDVPRIIGVGSAAQLQAAQLAEAGVSALIRCPPQASDLSSALRHCLEQPEGAAPVQGRLTWSPII